MALNADDAMSSYRPFGHHWLDTAVQETLLPGSPWQQVYEKLCLELAKQVHPELSDHNMRAVVFEMLGSEFLQKYFSKWAWDNPTQDSSTYSPEERKIVQQTTQLMLKEKLDLAATDCGYLVPKSRSESGASTSLTPASQGLRPVQVPEEVIATISKMAAIFATGLHRYQVQKGSVLPDSDGGDGGDHVPPKIPQLTHFTKTSLKGTHQNSSLTGQNHSEKGTVSMDMPSRFGQEEEKEEEGEGDEAGIVPTCWGQASDLLGRSLGAVLRRDPSRLDELCRRLMGRQLPGSLRHRVWYGVMLRGYKEAYPGEKSSEWFLRKNFAKTVLRGKAELGITSTTSSPINGLLETAVQEKYSYTPCLLKHRDHASFTKETREALNIMYVYDRSYQPYYIHWIYPIQLALRGKGPSQKKKEEPDDQPYELALQLNLLRCHVFPQWSEILAVAQRVMASVEKEDTEFFAHLTMCSKTNVKLDPKEFLVHQIQEEHQQAASFTARISRDRSTMATRSTGDRNMLASPLMFLRKWLGEGFVGVCDTNAVLFMWDQCFMSGWSHEVLHQLCLSLLMLLRNNFMALAQDYHVMKQIFLGEPCRLYTLDIQRAFQHLQNEGSLIGVPALNPRPVLRPGERKSSLTPRMTFDPSHYEDLVHRSRPDAPIPPTPLPLPKTPSDQSLALPISEAPPSPTLAPPTSAVPPMTSDSSGEPRPQPVASEETRLGISPVEAREDSLTGAAPSPARPLPVEEEPMWVPFDPNTTSDLPSAPDPSEGFDLYVDGVRFMPDNATISKVTGKFLNTPKDKVAPEEFSAHPTMTSLTRCPSFTDREYIEAGWPDQLVELRVWTLDKYTHQHAVVGVCLLRVYDDKTKKLNIGGHQLRLKWGYPLQRQPVLPQSLTHVPPVPACSLLIRLLPHSEDFLEAPPYNSGFYRSKSCKPTESEVNVINRYKSRSDWAKTEKEAFLEFVRKKDHPDDVVWISSQGDKRITTPWAEKSNVELRHWMIKLLEKPEVTNAKLTAAKVTDAKVSPPLLDIARCIDYERAAGLAVKVRCAFALQADNRYCIVLGRVLPGPTASGRLAEYGSETTATQRESFLTKDLDLDSHMRAPKWKDRPRVLHPAYDEQSVLLLQFFGLEVTYQIDPSGRTKGVVKGPKGRGQAQLDGSAYLGWGLLPLFDRGCVVQGVFIIPIFQEPVQNRCFLTGVFDAPSLESWMRVSVEKGAIRVHPSHPSAIVSLWDGHFYQGQTVPLQNRDKFLRLAGDYNHFSGASHDRSGHIVSEIVMRSLPSVVQKEGTAGQKYQREKANFEEIMCDLASEIVEDTLLTMGQAPLARDT